jgi:PPOX class probable F420-dependent enzyme
MPKGAVPERYRDILESTALGHLATIGPDGRLQVNPVWFLADGRSVYLSVKPETAKYRNLRANHVVAMSVLDLARPDRYIEVRGEVVEFELFETLAWVNQLARKYTGADFTGGVDGEPRYKMTIRVDAWTGKV